MVRGGAKRDRSPRPDPDRAGDGPTTRPPGWYPDPDHARGHRYWDGTQWTDRYTIEPPEPPPLPATATSDQAFGLIVLGVAGLGLLVVALFVGAALLVEWSAAPPQTEDGGGPLVEPETDTLADVPAGPPFVVLGTLDIPDGIPGELSIVATGPPEGQGVLVLLRNDASVRMATPEASGGAIDDAGITVGVAFGVLSTPMILEPGELAYGTVLFTGEVPADATLEIELAPIDVAASNDQIQRVFPIDDLSPTATGDGVEVLGTVANPTRERVSDLGVDGVCVLDGIPIQHSSTRVLDELAPDGDARFRIHFAQECDAYLVGSVEPIDRAADG